MKCWECEHFKIQYEPIGKISTGIWDFGRAKCTKHDLVVDFPDHRKLKKLECIEQNNGRKVGEVGMSEFIMKASTDELAEFCRRYSNMQELVRCKDCKHHGKGTCGAAAGISYPTPDDWYCADGERKEV